MTVTVTINERGEIAAPPARSAPRHTGGSDEARGVVVRDRAKLIEVRLSRDSVAPLALVGLLYWLFDNDQKAVAVMDCAGDAPVDVLLDRKRAAAYVSELIDRRASEPRFSRCHVGLDQTCFASVWRAAQEICVAEMSEPARVRILDQLFAGGFTLGTFDRVTGTCRASAVGSIIRQIDPDFAAVSDGSSYRNMADRAYGAWVAETFESYRDRDRPFAESIDASLCFPGWPKRARYTRLVVPYTAGGEKHLLVASDALGHQQARHQAQFS